MFTSVKLAFTCGVVTGVHESEDNSFTSRVLRGSVTGSLTDPDVPSVVESNNDLISRTNPTRIRVNLPVAVFELRELPRLIRSLGRGYFKAKKLAKRPSYQGAKEGAANINLTYQFGIAPLISDFFKLIDFAETVRRRTDELDRLHKKGGLKRRVALYSNTIVSDEHGPIVLNSFPSYLSISATYVESLSTERWGTIRWVPDGIPSYKTDVTGLQAQAALYALALQPSQIASNVWEALPWSWLIDYFVEIGNFLEVNGNDISLIQGNPCVMTTTKESRRYTVTSKPSWATISPQQPVAEDIVLDRFIGATNPSFAVMPYLNVRQLSILLSLSVAKNRFRK